MEVLTGNSIVNEKMRDTRAGRNTCFFSIFLSFIADVWD